MSVNTNDIVDLAVTEPKIANSAVTSNKIQNCSVTEQKLACCSVTSNKICNGAISCSKLDKKLKAKICRPKSNFSSFFTKIDFTSGSSYNINLPLKSASNLVSITVYEADGYDANDEIELEIRADVGIIKMKGVLPLSGTFLMNWNSSPIIPDIIVTAPPAYFPLPINLCLYATITG